MAKEQKPVSFSYYKLGPKASSFFDPISRLKVTRTLAGKIKTKDAKGNRKIIAAASSGHITKITEEEYNILMANATPTKGRKSKTIERVIVNLPVIKSSDELEDMSVSELKMHAFKLAKTEKQVGEIQKMRKAEDLIKLIESLQEAVEDELNNPSKSDEDDTEDTTEDDEEDTTDEDEDDDDASDDDEDEEK